MYRNVLQELSCSVSARCLDSAFTLKVGEASPGATAGLSPLLSPQPAFHLAIHRCPKLGFPGCLEDHARASTWCTCEHLAHVRALGTRARCVCVHWGVRGQARVCARAHVWVAHVHMYTCASPSAESQTSPSSLLPSSPCQSVSFQYIAATTPASAPGDLPFWK